MTLDYQLYICVHIVKLGHFWLFVIQALLNKRYSISYQVDQDNCVPDEGVIAETGRVWNKPNMT